MKMFKCVKINEKYLKSSAGILQIIQLVRKRKKKNK